MATKPALVKMSTFETLIRAQQIGVSKAQAFPTVRHAQLKRAILAIHDKATALAFKIDYLEFTKVVWSGDDPYQIVNENIGWCFSEMSVEDIQMWNEVGVKKPTARHRPMRF